MTGVRRKVRFEEMFPWEIAAAMAGAPLCYLPLGTLEWHGEHAAVGLDALKAHAILASKTRIAGNARDHTSFPAASPAQRERPAGVGSAP